MQRRFTNTAIIALGLAALLPATAQAAVRSLRCELTEGAGRIWGDPIRQSGASSTLIFDGIDRAQGRARLIVGSEAADVSLVAAPRRLTFVEFGAGGAVNVTTVFESSADMKAVHSRHGGTPENPVLSQSYGYCTAY